MPYVCMCVWVQQLTQTWTPEDQLHTYLKEVMQLAREKACWESNPGSHTFSFDASTLPVHYAPIPSHGLLDLTSL